MNFYNKYLIFLCVCIFLVQIQQGKALAVENLVQYCDDTYEKTKKCPRDTCFLGCFGSIIYEGCELFCQMRPCVELSVENCSTDRCTVMLGCDGKEVCYYRDEAALPGCGRVAYSGQEVDCCSGYVRRCGVEFFDQSCDMVGQNSMYAVPICLPCGNGVCNQFENRCNCPEDCHGEEVYKGLDYKAVKSRLEREKTIKEKPQSSDQSIIAE